MNRAGQYECPLYIWFQLCTYAKYTHPRRPLHYCSPTVDHCDIKLLIVIAGLSAPARRAGRASFLGGPLHRPCGRPENYHDEH